MRVVVFIDRFGTAEIVRVNIEPDPVLVINNSFKLEVAKAWLKGR